MEQQNNFERIILDFDETGYNNEVSNIKHTAELLNKALTDILEDLEIKLSDREIHKFIIERQSPESFINSLYSDQPKRVREMLQNEVRTEINNLHKDKYIYGDINKQAPFLTVKRGIIIPDEPELEKIKSKFEFSLDSERAKAAYGAHKEAYEKIKELIMMAEENKMYLTAGIFFGYNRDHELEMPKIDYNKF